LGAVAGSVVLALVATACADQSDKNPLSGAVVGVGDGAPLPVDDPEAVAFAAIEDVTAYWERTYPEIYGDDFIPLAGGLHPYGPDTEMPPCGDPRPSYEQIADNAFYCAGSDLIAWDAARLLPWINEQFGAFTIGIVFAHEYGHAIQARSSDEGSTIVLELQADCFAGAWTADVAAGNSRSFQVDASALDASLAGVVAISDAPGTSADDPLAHGSGFDRIGSFQDGFENGAGRCAEYPGTRLPIVEIPFDPGEDESSGGNLRLDDQGGDPGLLTRLEADLNAFYDLLFDQLGLTWRPVDDLVLVNPDTDEVTCGGQDLSGEALRYAAAYCEDENIALFDRAGLAQDLYEIGDFAVASEVARLYALAAQGQFGLEEGRAASLQADCLTGVWAFSSFERPDFQPDNLIMSAGDLDEGIMGFLAYDVSAEDTGSVFERTDALRTGFVNGYRGCEEFAPVG
jgi:predicted metalloprotease